MRAANMRALMSRPTRLFSPSDSLPFLLRSSRPHPRRGLSDLSGLLSSLQQRHVGPNNQIESVVSSFAKQLGSAPSQTLEQTAPAAMKGGGHYNNHSEVQRAAAVAFDAHFKQAVRLASFRVNQPTEEHQEEPHSLCLVDYGSCEGFNSLAPMSSFISEIRTKYGQQTPIMVVHNDLPTNDFSSLFRTVHSHPSSYAQQYPNVSVLASGTSFYQQVLPPRSVHFGYSSCAMHWLSRIPCRLTDSMNHLSLHAQSVEYALFAAQARADWHTILKHRSAELVKGGIFAVVLSCRDENDYSPLAYSIGIMYQVAQQMAADGWLSEEELSELTIRHYLRSYRELTDPSILSQCNLELVLCETKRPPNPLFEKYSQDGDDTQFAESWNAYTQARMEPSVLKAFSQSTHPSTHATLTPNDKARQFFSLHRERVLHDTNKHLYNGADRMLLVFRKC